MVRSEDSVLTLVTFWTSAEAAQRMELRWHVTAPSEQSGPMIGRGQGYRKRLCTKGNGFCTKGNGLCTKGNGFCTKGNGSALKEIRASTLRVFRVSLVRFPKKLA